MKKTWRISISIIPNDKQKKLDAISASLKGAKYDAKEKFPLLLSAATAFSCILSPSF